MVYDCNINLSQHRTKQVVRSAWHWLFFTLFVNACHLHILPWLVDGGYQRNLRSKFDERMVFIKRNKELFKSICWNKTTKHGQSHRLTLSITIASISVPLNRCSFRMAHHFYTTHSQHKSGVPDKTLHFTSHWTRSFTQTQAGSVHISAEAQRPFPAETPVVGCQL